MSIDPNTSDIELKAMLLQTSPRERLTHRVMINTNSAFSRVAGCPRITMTIFDDPSCDPILVVGGPMDDLQVAHNHPRKLFEISPRE
jgi:hypothetical protein